MLLIIAIVIVLACCNKKGEQAAEVGTRTDNPVHGDPKAALPKPWVSRNALWATWYDHMITATHTHTHT